MKNFLIAVLFIGLLVSLCFNWKGFGKSVNNDKYRVIELGKDSLVFDTYFESYPTQGSDTTKNGALKPSGQTQPNKKPIPITTRVQTTYVTTNECQDGSNNCLLIYDRTGGGNPPIGILPDPGLVKKIVRLIISVKTLSH